MHDLGARLDPFDLKLLSLMQKAADAPQAEISERVGLSPSQCSRRLKRLRDLGVVRRTALVLDADQLGLKFEARVLVTLKDHSQANGAAFRDAVARTPEILDCVALSGEADFLISIVARDKDHFYRVLRDKVMACPAIATVRSSLVLEHLKEGAPLPLNW
jgi:Lrp/AsnC family transcriptional regulator, leucine-responsive regulatory protein